MSHAPPVPSANQSPYPRAEPPHVHVADAHAAKTGAARAGGSTTVVAIAAVAGIAAVALLALPYWRDAR